jgi:acetyl esterase/lipase
MQTFLHIAGTNPSFDSLKGLVFTYGVYSWSLLPSAHTITDTVMLDAGKIAKFGDLSFKMEAGQLSMACDLLEQEFGTLAIRFNGTSHDHHLKHPAMSPLYRRLDQITPSLPPALFLCGTADPLLDDSILMSAHWQIAGGPATVKFVTGAPHAFVEAPLEAGDCNVKAADIIREFLEEKR